MSELEYHKFFTGGDAPYTKLYIHRCGRCRARIFDSLLVYEVSSIGLGANIISKCYRCNHMTHFKPASDQPA